jgi:hypothetical protein
MVERTIDAQTWTLGSARNLEPHAVMNALAF